MIRGKPALRHILLGSLIVLVMVLVALPAALARVSTKPVPQPVEDETDQIPIHVFMPEQKQVETMRLADYLVGVVAAEMPSEFADEALKAQFVVARTYAVRRMRQFNGKGGCSLEQAADICADPRTGQAYVTKAEYARKHGAVNANALWDRLAGLQTETAGMVLRYDGKFIDPLYHSVSGTRTENSGDYFQEQLPYLLSVDDRWGAQSPKLKATQTFSPAQLADRLENAGRPVAAPALSSAVKAGRLPVEVLTQTSSGRVATVRVLNETMSGRHLREALGLPSSNFTVTLKNGQIIFQTTGNGHGVGMSQYGADGMARAGKTYADILAHYYPGVVMTHLFGE